jgi:hypothetical protein
MPSPALSGTELVFTLRARKTRSSYYYLLKNSLIIHEENTKEMNV